MKKKKNKIKKRKIKTKVVRMNKPFKVKSNFKLKLKKTPLKQYKEQAHRVTYWTSLVVITTCNLLTAMFLVPFLMTLPKWYMYILITSIALVFGLLFNLIIRDIEIETSHHIVAVIFIPLITIINLFLMTTVANKLDTILNINIQHNPLIVSLLYAVIFLLPYAFSMRLKR